MQSKLNLNKCSKEELEIIREQIWDELYERERKKFPYKEGDCFIDSHQGISICRIDSLNKRGVDTTIIYIDALNNAHSFTSSHNYSSFAKDWTEPMDPEIFKIYSQNFKDIQKLRHDFVKKVGELRHAYKKRTTI